MSGRDRIAEAFACHGKSAALMPYLMSGFPDHETSIEAVNAAADAGADLIELGVPFSDPLADGPVIHAAATSALEAGATPDAGPRGVRVGGGEAAGGADGLRQRGGGRRRRSATPSAPPPRAPPG